MKSADGRFEYRERDDMPCAPGTLPERVHRFAYRCRQHATNMCSLNLRGRGHDIEKKSWTWDGNVDAPTLAPSINCTDCWHGFIERGVFLTTTKAPEPKQ